MRFWLEMLVILAAMCLGPSSAPAAAETPEGRALCEALVQEAKNPGKDAWRPMLVYLAELHGRSVHPPMGHFRRKPQGRRTPCRDYLGHNPLFAMVDLWRKCGPP